MPRGPCADDGPARHGFHSTPRMGRRHTGHERALLASGPLDIAEQGAAAAASSNETIRQLLRGHHACALAACGIDEQVGRVAARGRRKRLTDGAHELQRSVSTCASFVDARSSPWCCGISNRECAGLHTADVRASVRGAITPDALTPRSRSSIASQRRRALPGQPLPRRRAALLHPRSSTPRRGQSSHSSARRSARRAAGA